MRKWLLYLEIKNKFYEMLLTDTPISDKKSFQEGKRWKLSLTVLVLVRTQNI